MAQRLWQRGFLAAASSAALAGPALAGDGRVEINHQCALAGCFAGDTPDYPVTITGAAGRSYVLTSDLTLATLDTTGIRVQADDVSIDLGGFRIAGPASCSGTPPVCAATGAGRGITRDVSTRRGLSVSNGSVIGVGSTAITFGDDCAIRDVRVEANGFAGILAGANCRIEGVAAIGNFDEGIGTDAGSVVARCAANRNASHGIVARDSAVLDNAARANGEAGIIAQGASTVIGNVAAGNNRNGIEADAGSVVRANAASANAQRGLAISSDAAYSHNVMVGNGVQPVSGGANTGNNYCAGPGTLAATCP